VQLLPNSEPLVQLAASVTLIAIAVTGVLILFLLLLRAQRAIEQARHRCFMARWQPLLHAAISGAEPDYPPVAKDERERLLWLWNELQEMLRGAATGALARAGQRLRLDRFAVGLLKSRQVSRRLLGIVTLGNLADPRHWDLLMPLADDPHSPVSLAAAQALVRIDAARAVPELMPRFAARADWPVSRVHAMLERADPFAVTAAVDAALVDASDAAANRLIEFSGSGDSVALQHAMVNRLRRGRTPGLLANVLRHMQHPDHLELVRESCAHPVWFVRVQAANALSRMAREEDVDRLIALLGDAEWWVRYRAAEALLKLKFQQREALDRRLETAGGGAEMRAMLAKVAAKAVA